MKDRTEMEDTGSFLAPALLTGTSSEFMGRKPLPRLLRQRNVLFVLGPHGVGKSTVARVLCGADRVDLDRNRLEHALLDRVRSGVWHEGLVDATSLVVDGPVWLRNRAGAVILLLELAKARATAGRRTAFCQVESDGSIEELISLTEPGSAVVVGLRFPTGRTSRMRCAREMCVELGLPADAADGSESLDPWRYDRLVAFLVERAWRLP
ncbi:MAG: hypothetical protein ABMB14_01050 [Myxococcota bacterium]